MKLPDPDIQTGPWEDIRAGVQRNLDKLASALIDTGGQQVGIRFGTATWTWPGAALGSTPQTVAHGLGRTPVVVVAFPVTGPQGNALTGVAYTYTTTQFTVHGIFASFTPAAAATAVFGWVAVG